MMAEANKSEADAVIIRGETFAFRGDPFVVPPEQAVATDSDGAIVVKDGVITECGTAAEILTAHLTLPVHHYPGRGQRR